MTKNYIVSLTVDEQETLVKLVSSGTEKARKLIHARILLKANQGWQDAEICKALDVSIPTVERIRKRFVFEGYEASLKPRRSKRQYSRKLDDEQEAQVITLFCSLHPEG